jgi:hypothetical protein
VICKALGEIAHISTCKKKGGGKKVMRGLDSRLIGRPGVTPFL